MEKEGLLKEKAMRVVVVTHSHTGCVVLCLCFVCESESEMKCVCLFVVAAASTLSGFWVLECKIRIKSNGPFSFLYFFFVLFIYFL
jgi:hypothetical protein